jgi:hypothetical protein
VSPVKGHTAISSARRGGVCNSSALCVHIRRWFWWHLTARDAIDLALNQIATRVILPWFFQVEMQFFSSMMSLTNPVFADANSADKECNAFSTI